MNSGEPKHAIMGTTTGRYKEKKKFRVIYEDLASRVYSNGSSWKINSFAEHIEKSFVRLWCKNLSSWNTYGCTCQKRRKEDQLQQLKNKPSELLRRRRLKILKHCTRSQQSNPGESTHKITLICCTKFNIDLTNLCRAFQLFLRNRFCTQICQMNIKVFEISQVCF